jgi:c-di-GMP-binding flagellar brake protein YcgR
MSVALQELREFVGRIATVLWINPETQQPQHAPMMLLEASLHLYFQPLMGKAPLHEGQMVRVGFEDPQLRVRVRFNTRVVGPRGDGVLLRPPVEIERDRRHFERVPLNDPISVKRPHESGWLPVAGIDLSLGGVAFAAASPFRVDERIAVQLILLPADPVVIAARVVRAEDQRVAAAFDRLSSVAHRTVSAFVLRQQSKKVE